MDAVSYLEATTKKRIDNSLTRKYFRCLTCHRPQAPHHSSVSLWFELADNPEQLLRKDESQKQKLYDGTTRQKSGSQGRRVFDIAQLSRPLSGAQNSIAGSTMPVASGRTVMLSLLKRLHSSSSSPSPSPSPSNIRQNTLSNIRKRSSTKGYDNFGHWLTGEEMSNHVNEDAKHRGVMAKLQNQVSFHGNGNTTLYIWCQISRSLYVFYLSIYLSYLSSDCIDLWNLPLMWI